MTAPTAPGRARSFEGIIFFVYDREAVTKESDPPENAIVYFYPPSASIEDRISICGQLIGMSHFIHSFIGSRPALCKLQTEKVATVQSGKFTMALGGSLGEPDSLLIRQLETLLGLFTFYHGSLERIRNMCENKKQFLAWMNVIWDCYLHFVRHYGDFLPGVFDPLPFLELPKSVSATCFTKASYILQACQRRKHVLGGCILYSNRILCTQLEPSITERLLLLKPNQRNHPARPVKTGHDLPFGVRILNAFLTLSEYLNLYDALTESAYRQPGSQESPRAFPDMYPTSSPCVTDQQFPREGSSDDLQDISSYNAADSRRIPTSQISNQGDIGLSFHSTENVASPYPGHIPNSSSPQADQREMASVIVNQRESRTSIGADCLLARGSREKDGGRFGQTRRETIKNHYLWRESGLMQKEFGETSKTAMDKNQPADGNKAFVSPSNNRIDEASHKDDNAASSARKGFASRVRLAEKSTLEHHGASETFAILTEKSDDEHNGSEETIVGNDQHNELNNGDAAVVSLNTALADHFCHSNREGDAAKEGSGFKVEEDSSLAFDCSSIESNISNDVGLYMESIDVSGLKVVTSRESTLVPESEDGTFIPGSFRDGNVVGEEEEVKGKSDAVLLCRTYCTSNCRTENDVSAVMRLVLDEIITQVCEIIKNKNNHSSGARCEGCVELRSDDFLCPDAFNQADVSRQNSNAYASPQRDDAKNVKTCSKTSPVYFEQGRLESDSACRSPAPVSVNFARKNSESQTERASFIDKMQSTGASSSGDLSLRGESVKTPIVCDSFLVSNLNEHSPEKVMEKHFACEDLNTTASKIGETRRSDSDITSSNTALGADIGLGLTVTHSGNQDTRIHTYTSAGAQTTSVCITKCEGGKPVTTLPLSDSAETASLVSRNRESGDPYAFCDDGKLVPVSPVSSSSESESGKPVTTSPVLSSSESEDWQTVKTSPASSGTESEGGNPETAFSVSSGNDSKTCIAIGQDLVSSGAGIGRPVGTSLGETVVRLPGDVPYENTSVTEQDLEEHEILFEEEGDDINQVEGLTRVNLYVQAHSKVVLILLAEEGLSTDCNSIKALWETSLNQLGELEFLVKQSSGDEPTTMYSDEYSFLVYDNFERTMTGNLDELVHQVDHLFCETTKVLHEQFENCSTLKDVMLRNRSTTVYGKSNLGRGTYFQLKGPFRVMQGVPSHRDPFLKMEKRATKVLNKDHGVNIF